MRKFISYFLILFSLSSCHINSPSSGKKIGRIVKLESIGFLSKTWEGELIRGGLSDGSGSMGTTFYFTIEDKSLVETALICLEKQYEVVLSYEVEFLTSISRSEKSAHFIKKIDIKR